MGIKGPEKDRLSLVIEGPSEAMSSVRMRVFQALEELPLAEGTEKSPILFMRADTQRIVDLVAGIEGAELLVTPGDGYKLKLKLEEKNPPQLSLKRPAPPVNGYTAVVARDDGDKDDKTWTTSGEWQGYFKQVDDAKSIASAINVSRAGTRGLRRENRIYVENRAFTYKGESTPITTIDAKTQRERLLTQAEVRKWMSQVMARKR